MTDKQTLKFLMHVRSAITEWNEKLDELIPASPPPQPQRKKTVTKKTKLNGYDKMYKNKINAAN